MADNFAVEQLQKRIQELKIKQMAVKSSDEFQALQKEIAALQLRIKELQGFTSNF